MRESTLQQKKVLEKPTAEETESDSTEAATADELVGSTETSETDEGEHVTAEEPRSTSLQAEDPVIQEIGAEEFKALGNEAIKNNELKTALEHYNNGLKVEPDHAMILSNRALCYHKLGDLERALEDAQRVVELKPEFYKAYIRGAMVLRELKRPQEALALLKKAPNNDEVGKLVSDVRPEAEAAEEARIAALNGPEKMK